MPPEILPPPLAALPRLAQQALRAQRERELVFAIANDTRALAPYRTALVFTARRGRLRLQCVSGLTTVEPNGAFTLWAEQVAAQLLARTGPQGERPQPDTKSGAAPQSDPQSDPPRCEFSAPDVHEAQRSAWAEYWPERVSAFVLPGSSGQALGLVVYLREHPWPEPLLPLLHTLHQVHGAALQRLRQRSVLRAGGAGRARTGAVAALVLAAVAAALVFVPIRQFVVAPAEIVSLDAIAVTSPVEGVVSQLLAKPNQPVRKGDELFRLDDTTLRNRFKSAQEALEVARADFVASSHRALLNSAGAPGGAASTEAGVLRGRIAERLAELAYLREQLQLLVIRAPRDGIAVYGQENDWIGKPVAPGQRVMDLADATRPGVLVWLPVADAIQMSPGATLQVLLQTDPLNPKTATLEQASYQSMRSPDGVSAYRLIATLPPDSTVRLGLRGSARLDGQEVSLGYFLLRRPISATRQWLGW